MTPRIRLLLHTLEASAVAVLLTGATARAAPFERLFQLKGGCSVAAAGDVNDDGYDDVIVGACRSDEAYVYFGGPGTDGTADLTLVGETGGDKFGQSVAGAMDINGDGYDDVIVGAPDNDGGGENAGRAYIYFGGPAVDNVADLVLTGDVDGAHFGTSVAEAGDFNSDGHDDLLVGAPGAGAEGRAYLYLGGPRVDSIADLTFAGGDTGGNFGASVSGAGDFNADGFDDVVIGAFGVDRIFVYFGGPAADGIADLTTMEYTSTFGFCVARVGDFNGDGVSDLIVGAPDFYSSGPAGRAYIFFGGSPPNLDADLILYNVEGGDLLGWSVSGVGDISGDGHDDVIVGAPQGTGFPPYCHIPGCGVFAGRVYIYYGGAPANNGIDHSITGTTTGGNLGFAVAGAGDFNGDGLDDIIIDEYYYNHAYIYGIDTTTPTLLSLVNAEAETDRVRLAWYSEDRTLDATLYRCTTASGWAAMGRVHADGTGIVAYEDDQVTAGTRYGYRLGVDERGSEAFLGETWVDVPGAARFALEPPQPNPTARDLAVTFSLPSGAAARLELLDLAGRRVITRAVGALGPGSHTVDLAAAGRLASGIYLLRLTQGDLSQTARVAVVR